MKLKASIDYGIRAVAYIAAKGSVCSSREIAESMAIPRDYLIQLALRLRNAGIIKAKPGKNGGYALAKEPSEIAIGQIIAAFDTEADRTSQPMSQIRKADSTVHAACEMHGIITGSLEAFLSSVSVQDVIDASEGETSLGEACARALGAGARRLRAQ